VFIIGQKSLFFQQSHRVDRREGSIWSTGIVATGDMFDPGWAGGYGSAVFGDGSAWSISRSGV